MTIIFIWILPTHLIKQHRRPTKVITSSRNWEFLPVQLSEAVGDSKMAAMGKVMGLANKEMAGKADGKLIGEIVKAQLA